MKKLSFLGGILSLIGILSVLNSIIFTNYIKPELENERLSLKESLSNEFSIIKSKLNVLDRKIIEQKPEDIRVEKLEESQKVQSTTSARTSHDFLSRYKFYLDCKNEINPWKPDGNMPKYDPSLYNSAAPNSTHDVRIIRGVLLYFPIEKLSSFEHELKWLYRSWINMQTFEPKKWRTDLIIFINKENENFAKPEFFLNELNCKFVNKRTSPEDKPMCTLINYKSLLARKLPKSGTKKFNYDFLLDKVDIFSDDQEQLKEFYSLMNANLLDYNYLDSILMSFEGYSYFKSAGYDYLIRSDMDTFLTPMFSTWLPAGLYN